MPIEKGAAALRTPNGRRFAQWGIGLASVLGLRAIGLVACDGPDSASPSDASSIVYGSPYGDAGCNTTLAPREEPCVLADPYGVFVAPAANGGDDTGDGSMAHPFATLAKALSTSKSNVFVCNGSYSENVTVTSAVRVYGGLSCPDDGGAGLWTYTGGVATITAPSAVSPALSVTDAGDAGITIQDLTFSMPDQARQGWNPATGDGTSSIAAWIASSTVTLTRVTLVAGTGSDGAPGSDGVAASNYPLLADGGADPAPRGLVASDPPEGGAGGSGGWIVCANGASPTGGAGGAASTPPLVVSSGFPGAPPSSNSTESMQNGAGGSLANPDDPLDVEGGCPGNPGADGMPGAPAAAATVYGSLSADGWTPSSGGNGTPGGPGQGGGGGSGAAVEFYGQPQPEPGSGGAAGGCGGTGGGGGHGGGASIALLSVSSTIALSGCTLRVGKGGNGGPGGAGQSGQGGGESSGGVANVTEPDLVPCAGGAGGAGAGGSGGAGGTAGVAAGIVFTGSAPTYDSKTVILPGLAGSPGQPGAGGPHGVNPSRLGLATGNDGNEGAPGLASVPVLVLGL